MGGCEKFHLYLYGTQFKLYTDHKPLEFIYSPKGKPPLRIERWALRLQPYRFKVIHMPGKTNPADVVSRLPLSAQSPWERNIAEEYIHFITKKAVPKSMTLEQISKATHADGTLQVVAQPVVNQPRHSAVFQSSRRVINQTFSLAHEGHQGIVRTKQLCDRRCGGQEWTSKLNP